MQVGPENQPIYTDLNTTPVAVGNGAAVEITGSGLLYLKARAGNSGNITIGPTNAVVAGTGWVLAAGDVSPPLVLKGSVWVIADAVSQTLEVWKQT